MIFCFERAKQIGRRVRSGPIVRATVRRVSNHEIYALFSGKNRRPENMFDRGFATVIWEMSVMNKSTQLVQLRNECRSLSLMPAREVNSGTRAKDARCVRPFSFAAATRVLSLCTMQGKRCLLPRFRF